MHDDTARSWSGRVSVIDPISNAIEWARDVLFRPFDFEKWIILGFCAWISMLGEGGSPSFNWHVRGRHRPDVRDSAHEAWVWFLDHLVPILLIAGFVLAVLIVIGVALLWVSSRGKFLFLDGVVRNRAAVAEPWRSYRVQGNSLFWFRLVFGLAVFAVVMSVIALAGLTIWGLAGEADADPWLILIAILAVLCIVCVGFAGALVGLALNDFVVPLMYLRRSRVSAAWSEFGGLLSARPGAFILYVLVKVVIAFVAVAIGILACCLTCCIAALPFIGTVILLPLHVFRRAYPLYFLGQFGPRYARFEKLGPGAPPQPPK